MFLPNSSVVCLLIVLTMVQDSSSFCQPFNKTLGLEKMCGYSSTANFTHAKHFDTAVRSMLSVTRLLSKCSPYASLVACSVYTPRCEENIPGPFLPCRRVCDEFNRQCGKLIFKYGMEWIVGMCKLLPEQDDPNTTLGYLGRCFEPPNFITNLTKPIPLKCSPLIVPICQYIGYTHTVFPVHKQQAFIRWASGKINDARGSAECSLPQRRFFCSENFPPCIDNSVGFYCRPKCQDFFKTNCTVPLNYKEDICMELPKGSGLNDICKQTQWPRAENWPRVRDSTYSHLTTSMVDTSTSSTPGIRQQPSPTSETVQAKNASALKGKGETRTKAKVAPIVGGVLAGLFAIAIVLLIVYLIHKNKKVKDKFPPDKQILYNDDNVEISA